MANSVGPGSAGQGLPTAERVANEWPSAICLHYSDLSVPILILLRYFKT